ncbi:MAG: hypothetical protein V3T82_08055 [Nitrospinaceae bacterium]
MGVRDGTQQTRQADQIQQDRTANFRLVAGGGVFNFSHFINDWAGMIMTSERAIDLMLDDADLFTVEGKPYLLIAVSYEQLEALSTHGSDTEDLEELSYG